jgi:hypothetical protein
VRKELYQLLTQITGNGVLAHISFKAMKRIDNVLIKEMASFARLTAVPNNLNSKFYELGTTYDQTLWCL